MADRKGEEEREEEAPAIELKFAGKRRWGIYRGVGMDVPVE